MEVKELIEKLKRFDPDMEVGICDDDTGEWLSLDDVRLVEKNEEHVYIRRWDFDGNMETCRPDANFVGVSSR